MIFFSTLFLQVVIGVVVLARCLVDGIVILALRIINYVIVLVNFIQLRMDPKKLELRRRLKSARTYSEWREISKALEKLETSSKPKKQDVDIATLESFRLHLKKLAVSGDTTQLVRALTSVFHRDYGMFQQEPMLQMIQGVKVDRLKTVETFQHEVEKAVKSLTARRDPNFQAPAKLKFLLDASMSLGNTALCLSGGATLAMKHLGVVMELLEQGLLPRIISGASGGAIVAGIIGVTPPHEMKPGRFQLKPHETAMFDSKWNQFVRFVKTGRLADPDIFMKILEYHLGDYTFEEAFRISGKVIAITVSAARHANYPTVLCHLTSPKVLMRTAVRASCSFPVLLPPFDLLCKDDDGNIIPYMAQEAALRFVDGSINSDMPMEKLSQLFHVNSFIVSQVNPHVAPFIGQDDEGSVVTALMSFFRGDLKGNVTKLSEIAWGFPLLRRFLHGFAQIYTSDMTIVPEFVFTDFLLLTANVGQPVLDRGELQGRRATWPKVWFIRYRYLLERTLHTCIEDVREELEEASTGHVEFSLPRHLYSPCARNLVMDDHDWEVSVKASTAWHKLQLAVLTLPSKPKPKVSPDVARLTRQSFEKKDAALEEFEQANVEDDVDADADNAAIKQRITRRATKRALMRPLGRVLSAGNGETNGISGSFSDDDERPPEVKGFVRRKTARIPSAGFL